MCQQYTGALLGKHYRGEEFSKRMSKRVRCLETFKLEMQTEAQIGTVGRCCRAVMPGVPHIFPLQCATGMGGWLPAPN